MSLRPLLASRKAARAFALVLAVCLGLSIMLGAAAPESDADEVPPFRFTGRMGQGVCDTLWVWAHHLDEARQDVLTEQSLQAAVPDPQMTLLPYSVIRMFLRDSLLQSSTSAN